MNTCVSLDIWHFIFFLGGGEYWLLLYIKKHQIYEIINKSFGNDSRIIFASFQRLSWDWNNNVLVLQVYFNLQPLYKDKYVLDNDRILQKLHTQKKMWENSTLSLVYCKCKFSMQWRVNNLTPTQLQKLTYMYIRFKLISKKYKRFSKSFKLIKNRIHNSKVYTLFSKSFKWFFWTVQRFLKSFKRNF